VHDSKIQIPQKSEIGSCTHPAQIAGNGPKGWTSFRMNSEDVWLIVANIWLGAVTVACIILFVRVVLKEVLHKPRKHSPDSKANDGSG
jgi:hypothetical protein